MVKLFGYLIYFALAIGVGEAGVKVMLEMAGKAANAHQHDQISYSKWNGILWGKGMTRRYLKNR